MRKRLTVHVLLTGICLCALSLSPLAQKNAGVEPGPVLLVANQDDRSLSIIDAVAARQIAVIPVGGITGHEVAASPDGRTAYVPIYGDSGVGEPGSDGRNMVVIDIPTRKVIGNVDFGHGVRPHCVIFDATSGMLYVTTELDNSVAIIDPHTLKIVGAIPTTQKESHMLAISHDGRRGYTSNVGAGTVSVLDMTARKTITVIPIAPRTQRISISNDDSMVFASDSMNSRLAVIDTATNKLKTWVELPGRAYGAAPTVDGKWLLVSMPPISRVAVIELETLKVVHTIEVQGAPHEILVRPDGQVAYVTSDGSQQVSVIDLSQWKVQALIDARKGADGLAWAGKPSAKSSTAKH